MTYEPWKLREDAARYDRMGERLDTDLMRAHAAALEENKRLAAKVAELETALLGIKQYREKNPLGGPAKVFDAMADQIRAGDDFNKVIADYGWCPVSRAERAEAALAECRAKLEVDPRTKYDGIDCRDETIRMLENELEESARLHGMGASREAALQARLAESERKCERMKALLHSLHALVWGECPSLLNEDSGGSGHLDADIRAEFKEG